jgi:curli biogenesis system outer membrane secretion channel CsgG
MGSRHCTRTLSAAAAASALLLAACASESHRTLETRSAESRGTAWTGPRHPLAIGEFQNRSSYLQGAFASGPDALGSQARTILTSRLTESGRFDMLDRANLDATKREAGFSGTEQQIAGARYVVSGEVTEFGRRNTGDHQLFGLLGRGNTQTAYANVTINIVDVASSRVVYTCQGAGEYDLGTREVVGTGSTAGYDSTLNGKVLDLAITDGVNKLVRGLESNEWGGGR